MNITEKAYKEIFKVLDKYKGDIVFDIDRLRDKAENHLFGVELVEKYGFDIDPKTINSSGWQELKRNVFIAHFASGNGRSISWPDDGNQPDNETLLILKFSTGAYFLDDDYPVELFERFFLELKSFGPKFVDSKNKSLYFNLENAGKIYNAYDSIVNKYRKENKADRKTREINRMKDAIAKLESKT